MSYFIPIKDIIKIIAEEIPNSACHVEDSGTEWNICFDCKGNFGQIDIPKDGSKISFEHGYESKHKKGKCENILIDILNEYDRKMRDCSFQLKVLKDKFGSKMIKRALESIQ